MKGVIAIKCSAGYLTKKGSNGLEVSPDLTTQGHWVMETFGSNAIRIRFSSNEQYITIDQKKLITVDKWYGVSGCIYRVFNDGKVYLKSQYGGFLSVNNDKKTLYVSDKELCLFEFVNVK